MRFFKSTAKDVSGVGYQSLLTLLDVCNLWFGQMSLELEGSQELESRLRSFVKEPGPLEAGGEDGLLLSWPGGWARAPWYQVRPTSFLAGRTQPAAPSEESSPRGMKGGSADSSPGRSAAVYAFRFTAVTGCIKLANLKQCKRIVL